MALVPGWPPFGAAWTLLMWKTENVVVGTAETFRRPCVCVPVSLVEVDVALLLADAYHVAVLLYTDNKHFLFEEETVK